MNTVEAFIKHISIYLPDQKLTNDDLSRLFPNYTPDNIYEKTGIRERRIAKKGETAVDLAVKAAEKLFDEHNVSKAEIDFLIFCTTNADYFTPSSSCIIQDRLGLNNIGSFDINLGCTGFVYCLSVANGLIASRQAKNILILNSEPMDRLLHREDRSGRLIFGDAAAATLISCRDESSIGNFVFGSDGKKADIMMIKVGAARYPFPNNPDIFEFKDEHGNISSPINFYMKGAAVFDSTIQIVPDLVKSVLKKNNQSIEDVNFFIFHQANGYMLEILRKISKIPKEKFIVDLEKTGNTVSCTIPLAIYNGFKNSIIQRGDKVVLITFGVGFSWGGTIVTI